ncbi:HlyD family secretion protein [Pelagibacterium sp.]|uniref:HlyD family secretion protein n=1 Tax=Pelagibacterium sp. TaxID=1967288 RepID=UPI003BA918B8
MDEFVSWLFGLIAMIVPGFGVSEPPAWNGYVEADYVYLAAPAGGTLTAMAAREGDAIEVGDIVFTLDDGQQRAALDAALAQVAAAQANVDNLSTGSRDAELDVIRASLARARADLELTRQQAERTGALLERGLAPQAQADQANANLERAQAQVDELEAQLRVAELPARDPQRIAAEASLAAARANAEQARLALDDRVVTSPVDGLAARVYFSAGEFLATGIPAVALLPVDALKVKFYLPQADRTDFELGDAVSISCDLCPDGLTATVRYFSPDPQFTPPVIYSREERARLTFLVEAVLDEGSELHPGQPVTVSR